jgi:ornithine cyclodeaminase
MTDDVLYLSRERVTELLDTDAAIASQRAAFTALGDGTAERPVRRAARAREAGR